MSGTQTPDIQIDTGPGTASKSSKLCRITTTQRILQVHTLAQKKKEADEADEENEEEDDTLLALDTWL